MPKAKIARDRSSIIKYIKSRPGITARILTKNLKISANEAHLLMSEVLGSPSKKRKVVGHTRKSFQATYDHDTRQRESLRVGVASLTDPDEIIEDAEFRKDRCPGSHTNRFRQIAEESEFKQYQFVAGGKIHWTHPETKKWAIANVEGAKDL